MNSVPLIVGPTAIGKTALSCEIAYILDVEIISADSRQIYRFLDIGTAKPSKNELEKVQHHMINFLRPDEYFSAGMYSQIGRRIIDQVLERGKIPLVVGGSGLYIRALVDGLHSIDIRDDKIRHSLRFRLSKEGIDSLYKELKMHDPEWAGQIKPTDKQRIIRGLEVFFKTGKKLSDLQESDKSPSTFKPVFFGLKAEKKFLHERINHRVDKMFENGFLSEATNLKLRGFSPQLNALNSVGYREIFDYIDDRISYDLMIELIKRNTRRYAKRQMTWFRADKRIQWYDVDQNTDLKNLAQTIVTDFETLRS
jgi:tRNA dimethylallyltransferase